MSSCDVCGRVDGVTPNHRRLDTTSFTDNLDGTALASITYTLLNLCGHCVPIIYKVNSYVVGDCLSFNGISDGNIVWSNYVPLSLPPSSEVNTMVNNSNFNPTLRRVLKKTNN